MLIEKVNEYICNPMVIDTRGRKGYYPSEASAIDRFTGDCVGKCLRAAYYSWTDTPKTNPVDARGMWTFAFGSNIERMWTNYFKEIGIWAGNNVKFFDKERNVSGEADIFIFDQDKNIVGVEMKTAYGYGFQSKIKVAPKPENLMQVGLYLQNFPQCPYWILIYHARDTHEQVEYHISLKTDNVGTHLMVNHTIPIKNWYMEDVYKRYDLLGQSVALGVEPDRDFTYAFTRDQSRDRFACGKISKTKFAKVEKGLETDSDWQCLYCSYLDKCWAQKRGEMRR